MGQQLDVTVVFIHTVVETRDIHHLGEARLQGILCPIHALGHRTCGVELMAEVLQVFGNHPALIAPLLWDLVADAPHDDGGMVAVRLHECRDILVAPGLEEPCVAILTFRVDPHVEALRHDHHAEGVAHIHLHLRGEIVRGTDGVAAHLLQLLYLSDNSGFVHGSAERTEVMVEADTLELAAHTVEPEAMDGVSLNGPNAKAHGEIVQCFPITIRQRQFQRIEVRGLRCPPFGVLDDEATVERRTFYE